MPTTRKTAMQSSTDASVKHLFRISSMLSLRPPARLHLTAFKMHPTGALQEAVRLVLPRPMFPSIDLSHIIVKNKIGSGGFGDIYRAVPTEQSTLSLQAHQFALKIIRFNPLDIQDRHCAKVEIKAHAAVNGHENIVCLHNYIRHSRKMYVIMELLRGGTVLRALLKRRAGHFTERVAIEIALQTCKAVLHMHKRGVAHRDIKPENLLLAEDPRSARRERMVVKVIDFGLAHIFDSARHRSMYSRARYGTWHYMAPEQQNGGRYRVVDVDIYSIGVVLYELLTGVVPFGSSTSHRISTKQLVKEKLEGPSFEESVWGKITQETKALVAKCLSPKPWKRPNAEELVSFLDVIGKRLNEK